MKERENQGRLESYLERAMAIKAALTLFEWDNETLAPQKAGTYTARIQGALSAAYQELMTGPELVDLLKERESQELSEEESAIVREAWEERRELSCIPPKEYRAYQELVSESARTWADAKKKQDFDAFAPVLEKIISYQKKFAGYQARKGQRLYDVMLDHYEKGFSMEKLDEFFEILKRELVPFLQKVIQSGVDIPDDFLTGNYSEEKQRELAEFLARYVGFDFDRGVLAESAHPFTTNLHNHDVRLTTHYKERVDSSLFSVIHESGHGIYELGIGDELTLTLVGQGASMGMHESQSRFFENIIGRNEAFWVPVYGKLQELFPQQLGKVDREDFVRAVNKVKPGLIRTEADELTYSLHVMIRYELEKMLIEDNLDVRKLPEMWADKYEEYLGVRPEHPAEGVLQDIHWAQGSFGYFPSYALGSAFAAQIYQFMRKNMDFEGLLRQGEVDVIRQVLNRHIHRFGKVRDSRRLLMDMTGEDFKPQYYVEYLKEKYGKLYGVEV
ncbi:carboxypeptidase M32 [Clostridiaceae bacterium]|nr:carboxypeptidase M32 [Clostridiaceae bacterium]